MRTSICATAAAGAAAILVLCTSQSAHADCVAREGELVWSWPADGATNVNPETGFTAIAYASQAAFGAGGELVVRMNSAIVELTASPNGRWSIPLEPSSEYVVEFDFGDGDSETVTFTTGESELLSDELPAPELVSMSWQEFFDRAPGSPSPFRRRECGPVFGRSDCFDTGPRWLVELEHAPLVLQDYTTDDIVWETVGPEGVEYFGGQASARLPGAFCDPTVSTSNIELTEAPRLRPMCIRTRYYVPDGRTSEWSEPLCTPEPYLAPGTWPPEPGTDAAEDAGLATPGDADAASTPDVSGDLGENDAGSNEATNGQDDENVGCSSTGRASSPWAALGLTALGAVLARRRRS